MLAASLISSSVVRADQIPQEATTVKPKWQARGVRAAAAEIEPVSAQQSVPISLKAAPPAPPKSLAWRAHGLRPAIAAASADDPAPVSAPEAVTAVADQTGPVAEINVDQEQPTSLSRRTARRSAALSSRAKTREAVMQVSAYQADAVADPFGDRANEPGAATESEIDPGAANPPSELELPPPAEPSREEAPSADNEPPVLGPEGIPEQPLPDSSTNGQPLVPDFVPPQTGNLSCDLEKRECERAIQELRGRDIRKIVPALLIQGDGGQPAVEGRDFPCECTLGTKTKFAGRDWAPLTFTWKATSVCHKPLYFEDAQLERYGHSWNPVVQPFMSAAHFFISVPLLPYKMGLNPPNECMYSLGYYRPGDCAPYMIDPIPLSLRGAAYQALGVTGFVFWFWPPVPLPA
ncbi:MAG TPA: hypothetical protein VHV08_16930, partial [Pirellulales bacterium]|nr:hypothetical protein [Pirellulales bacterium]